VNKCDRPNAEVFINHLKQMIRENAPATNLLEVVGTIATEKEGIPELLAVIHTHQLAVHNGAQKKEMLFAKVLQLISANKMSQVDLDLVKAKLEEETAKKNFNIFKFAQIFN